MPQNGAQPSGALALSTRQKLVVAAYTSIPRARDAALVLGVSEHALQEELRIIRTVFRQAGYRATASRPALLSAARRAAALPGAGVMAQESVEGHDGHGRPALA